MLLCLVLFGVHQNHQKLPCQTAFQEVSSQPVLVVSAVICPQGYDSVFPLIAIHGVSVSPFLHLFKVPLNGCTTIWCINHSHFCIITCMIQVKQQTLLLISIYMNSLAKDKKTATVILLLNLLACIVVFMAIICGMWQG